MQKATPKRLPRERQNQNIFVRCTSKQKEQLLSDKPEGVSINQHILEKLGLSTPAMRWDASRTASEEK